MEFGGKVLPQAVVETNIPFLPKTSGKIRDIYDLGERLVIVATDRISAYDSVLASAIPCKGRVLTSLSLFWFDFLKDVTPNHLVTAAAAGDERLAEKAAVLTGRSMLVRKADVMPVECIVRGYLSGSGWRSYRDTGEICGIRLPDGLRESDRLPDPIFTPTTKADAGHDENMHFAEVVDLVGESAANAVRETSLAIYAKAAAFAAEKGIIIADTKFEFGVCDGEIILVDEVLTPDSSRFWPADDYEPGRSQQSFDKQFVRDYLDESGWDHSPPAPALPDDVVVKTLGRYVEAYERITGEKFAF
ncbi:MAG: phosphoribosylaminoimidazolesuccinocarboxamide synthase [Planctomycetes bacterium]|nr:phosphoribosylaminoimidazolesuccinocarboxamide synthase [Planctomycetota bacterium]